MSELELPTELLLGDLEAVIRDHARANWRSQQVEIGPSEVGAPCERRLALKLLGTEPVNTDRDDWTSTVGTALHTWMEGAFLAANKKLEAEGRPPRWLVEAEVDVRTGMKGHVDVYDIWTGTVLDHKFPGVTSIRKKKRANDPSRQYRWQGHLYGYGWAQLGLPVNRVAICFYPRSGLIRDSWLWSEPYDESVAHEALARLDSLLVGMDIAEAQGELSTFVSMLHRDVEHCGWCPFYAAGHADPLTGCGGATENPGYAETHATVVPGIL